MAKLPKGAGPGTDDSQAIPKDSRGWDGASDEAHSRLFGHGAKKSKPDRELTILTSPDDWAMARRPRSATAGKDIKLPASKSMSKGRR